MPDLLLLLILLAATALALGLCIFIAIRLRRLAKSLGKLAEHLKKGDEK